MAKISKNVFLAEGSVIRGDVTLEDGCSIWYNAVLRGDMAPIRIDQDTNVQDGAVLHVDIEHPLIIGKGVTIGHGAIVHGCTIGDNSLIGMGAIILNGAMIGKNCIIGAGSLVTGGTVIPDNSVVFGSPAKVRHTATVAQVEGNRKNAEHYLEMAARERD